MAQQSMPVRLDGELVESARKTAPAMSRSLAEQLSHWARLGRELERSPAISLDRIREVLEGRADYDALGQEERSVVRARQRDAIEQRRSALRLDREFARTGHRYSELRDDGTIRTVDASATAIAEARKDYAVTTKARSRKKAGVAGSSRSAAKRTRKPKPAASPAKPPRSKRSPAG